MRAVAGIDARQALLPLDAAVRRLREVAVRLPDEPVPLPAVAGRVLAVDIRAPEDLPGEANSALDGYALRAVDAPGPLPVAFEVAAGDDPPPLEPGRAAGIATGGVLPDGADAVLPVERAARDGDAVRVAAGEVRAGDGVRAAGEDLRAGDLALPAGTRLTPLAAAGLAGLGLDTARCVRRPRAAVLVTGAELVAPGKERRRGQVHDSNSTLVVATLGAFGCEVLPPQRVADAAADTVHAFEGALGADLVVSSGGVSVGPHDHVKPALAALGVEQLFWRVAIQPGKPVWAGTSPTGAVVLGLPGNPLSALVGLHLLVRPLLAAMLGVADEPWRSRLAVPLRRSPSRLRALPVVLDGEWIEPRPAGSSHQLLRAVGAGGLVLVPPGADDAPAGSAADVVPLEVFPAGERVQAPD